MNPLTAVPAKVRYYVYLLYAVVMVIWGALSVAYADPDPDWINRGGDVLQYLGGALALTAASNVTEHSMPPPAPENNPLR